VRGPTDAEVGRVAIGCTPEQGRSGKSKMPCIPLTFDDAVGFGRGYKSSDGDSCYAGHKSFCWHPIRHPRFL
jgi:hypothetical protein